MRAMLCSHFTGDLPASYCVEPKLDGIRVLIHFNAKFKEVTFKSRNGKALPALAHLADQVLAFAGPAFRGDMVLDAEATCPDASFFDTVGVLRRKSEAASKAVLTVFDYLNVFDNCAQRRAFLEQNTTEQPSVRLISRTVGNPNVVEAYHAALAAGHEGIIIKDLASDYEGGERSGAWQKMKESETHDCKVVAVTECPSQPGLVGALIVDFAGVAVSVGSGFKSNAERRAVWGLRATLVGKTVEVACHMKTPSGSMRHPTFVRIRDDK
jgi:DNA ligase-1